MDRERVLENWTVIVADGRIREPGPASAISVPESATVIDGQGKYLMPGLVDMHAHTWEEDDFPLRWAQKGSPAAAFIGWALLLLGAGMNPQRPPQEQVEEANRQKRIKKRSESADPES